MIVLMVSSRSRSSVLSPFSRVTSSGAFVPEIDGLRFVAIAAVVFFHLAINLSSRNQVDYAHSTRGGVVHTVLGAGSFGVQLFFIISGIVLALPFARHHLRGGKNVSLIAYFARRVTRLEPPYIIAMVGSFLVLTIIKGGSISELTPHLLASLVYLHTLTYGTDSLINNVAWSLEVEIQFYLLVPLLSAVFAIRQARTRRATIATAIAATSLFGPLLAGISPHLDHTVLRFLQYFLVGFLIADLMVTDQLRPRRPSFAWDAGVIGCAVIGIMLHTKTGAASWLPGVPSGQETAPLMLLPWVCLVAYLGAFKGRLINAFLRQPVVTTIGGMCYSIYLLHNVVQNNTLSPFADIAVTGVYALDFLVQAMIATCIVMPVAALFFVLIERPCMNRDWPTKLAQMMRRRRDLPSPSQQDGRGAHT